MKFITYFFSVFVLCCYSFGAPEEEDRVYERFYDNGQL